MEIHNSLECNLTVTFNSLSWQSAEIHNSFLRTAGRWGYKKIENEEIFICVYQIHKDERNNYYLLYFTFHFIFRTAFPMNLSLQLMSYSLEKSLRTWGSMAWENYHLIINKPFICFLRLWTPSWIISSLSLRSSIIILSCRLKPFQSWDKRTENMKSLTALG